ncbi:MAG TPA: PP2C family protein-serine/threonine phosphatase, partial [Bryobacteraceae bacterium]|nr:PP2C family protein-serine/threonine phosphatase [Bryobacteraceae bacterium]
MNSNVAVPVSAIQHALRSSLPFIAVATIALVAGLAAILLSRLRSRDRLLLWLGICATLYGLRLLLQNDLIVRAITPALNARPFDVYILLFTYLIPIPLAMFVRELRGPGWKHSIAIWVWVQIVFAILAIPLATLARESRWTDLVNGLLVIGGTVLTITHLAPRRNPGPASALKWPFTVFGVLVVLNNFGFRFRGADVEPVGFVVLLSGLAYAAARRAISRERKLTEVEQELATARRIQTSILPADSPHLPALRIATRYQPMTAVAGDFYDFLQTRDTSVTILVADVSGHGVPAALVASMLKVCLAAQREHADDPARVLTGLNAMLRGMLGGQYVTAACAALDLSAETVRYAGAGHPPALLVRRSSGELVELGENGLFIGPFPHATYSNMSVPFAAGDRLLLYTDGITEA